MRKRQRQYRCLHGKIAFRATKRTPGKAKPGPQMSRVSVLFLQGIKCAFQIAKPVFPFFVAAVKRRKIHSIPKVCGVLRGQMWVRVFRPAISAFTPIIKCVFCTGNRVRNDVHVSGLTPIARSNFKIISRHFLFLLTANCCKFRDRPQAGRTAPASCFSHSAS